jgi:hypothetical protein
LTAVLKFISSVGTAIREFHPENDVKNGRKCHRHADYTSWPTLAEYPVVKIPAILSNDM